MADTDTFNDGPTFDDIREITSEFDKVFSTPTPALARHHRGVRCYGTCYGEETGIGTVGPGTVAAPHPRLIR